MSGYILLQDQICWYLAIPGYLLHCLPSLTFSAFLRLSLTIWISLTISEYIWQFARYRGAFAPKNISRQFLVNLNFFNFFTITRMSAFPGCPNIFWENGNISFTELTYSDLKQVIIFRASLPCSRSILASSSN